MRLIQLKTCPREDASGFFSNGSQGKTEVLSKLPRPVFGERVGVRGPHGADPAFGEIKAPDKKYPTAKARSLRSAATRNEKNLWKLLRNRRLVGLKFRRQHPVGPFFIDFFCIEKNLGVELDGGGHFSWNGARDVRRDRALHEAGVQIVRISNNELREDRESVLRRIRIAAERDPLTPALSPQRGEGVVARKLKKIRHV